MPAWLSALLILNWYERRGYALSVVWSRGTVLGGGWGRRDAVPNMYARN